MRRPGDKGTLQEVAAQGSQCKRGDIILRLRFLRQNGIFPQLQTACWALRKMQPNYKGTMRSGVTSVLPCKHLQILHRNKPAIYENSWILKPSVVEPHSARTTWNYMLAGGFENFALPQFLLQGGLFIPKLGKRNQRSHGAQFCGTSQMLHNAPFSEERLPHVGPYGCQYG